MTPRCAASTRSLRTWSVAWPRSSPLPIVCQYASRADSTSDATAKKANSTRSRACEIVAVILTSGADLGCPLPADNPRRRGRSPRVLLLALGGDLQRRYDPDCGRPDQTEPLRGGLDPRGRVEPRALDLKERVLSSDFVALRRKTLGFIARRRNRRGLGEIEEDEEKPRDDHAAHEEERADLPARASSDRTAIRGTAVDGLPKGTVLHAPHMRRAHGLRECQGRRSATRRAALRARGLRPTSAEAARSGRRVTTRKPARCPQTQVGRWGGQMQSRDSRAKNCLTIRSSSEWNEITTIRPPGRRTRMAAASPCSRFASSSLTAMRRAWKTRVAGSMPRGLRVFTPATKRPRSSAAPNGVLTRRRTIAPATRAASGSSPYSAKTRRRSFSAQLFTSSAAVVRRSGW